MIQYPASITRLIRNLSKLPGIGEKSAERLAMYLLQAPKNQVVDLAESLTELKEKVRLCRQCFALSDEALCRICSDPARDGQVLCVVEHPVDMVAIEKTASYKGLYHVLQGLLSPMDGIGPEDIRIRELIKRVSQGSVKEVIIATGTNVEGETTAAYIHEQLSRYPVNVTRIASGVPMGGELKYVDQVTLKKALEGRRAV
ncbi:MAG TPA: recombination mediator RecR [Desulfosalsimonadaceae bacterium]|nr:recombination mediator RecR [Desulfosalsimonadaceae bacterium]